MKPEEPLKYKEIKRTKKKPSIIRNKKESLKIFKDKLTFKLDKN